MPPKIMKRKAIKKMMKKRIEKAIEEYEKSRANPGKASGSGPANTGGTVNIEKVEQVFEICKCTEENKVMFAASTFEGRALTWWNGNVDTLGDDIEAYNIRFHALALMCPDLVPTEKKKVKSDQGRATRISESNKRKWEDHQKTTPTTITPTTSTATATTTISTSNRIGDMRLLGPMWQPKLRLRVMLGIYQCATVETLTIMDNALKSVRGAKELVIKRKTTELGFQVQVLPPRDVTCYGCGEKGKYKDKVLWIWFGSWIDFDEVLVVDFSIMDAPPSPNHVFNFPEVEFEKDHQEEPEEEFEEDPEEDPKEELEVEAEDNVPPHATPPVGSPITPPPLSESSSNTEDVALIVANETLEMPPIGSTYEVGGPSFVSPFPPFYLHGREISRLDDNTELLLSNVKYLERCEKKRKTKMEASSSEIHKVKKRMDEIGQDLGDEIQFSNLVEHRVTKLEDKDQGKVEEMEKIKKLLGTLETNCSLVLSDRVEIMPPKMMKRKAVKKMVKKHIAEAIEEYEKTRVNLCNASRSGVTNTGGSVNVQATKIQRMEEELWTLTLKGDDIKAYNCRFHKLALMCPNLVPNEKKKIERYMKGFPERIKGNITSSRPTTLHDAINLNRRQETARAYAAAPAEGKVYAETLPKCNRCNLHHNGQCPPKCQRHMCPKERNQQNEGARARAYVVVENL
nr:hypothetical protein [Tanacetum cinerariifolium]